MVLAATAVIGVCMAMMPQKVEAGGVSFRISQTYAGGLISLHRLWYWGEARHWNPKGGLITRSFTHVPSGYEWAHFGEQLNGRSKGDARVTWGLVCKESTCKSKLVKYTVKPCMTLIVDVGMSHPK
jgi:hypothetical protein